MEPIIQSNPSVLRGTPHFVVLPVDYRELWVEEHPIGDYLASKPEGQRARFLEDLAMADAEFRARMGERLGPAVVPFPSPGVFTLRAWFERWEPGEWFLSDAEAQLLISVFNDKGHEVERVRIGAHEVANVVHPTPTDRLRSCARKLADRTARYIDDRGK